MSPRQERRRKSGHVSNGLRLPFKFTKKIQKVPFCSKNDSSPRLKPSLVKYLCLANSSVRPFIKTLCCFENCSHSDVSSSSLACTEHSVILAVPSFLDYRTHERADGTDREQVLHDGVTEGTLEPRGHHTALEWHSKSPEIQLEGPILCLSKDEEHPAALGAQEARR